MIYIHFVNRSYIHHKNKNNHSITMNYRMYMYIMDNLINKHYYDDNIK